MSDFDKAKILAECIRIQHNCRTIRVRSNLDGTWKDVLLAELPAELAVWWAMHWVINEITGRIDTPLPDLEKLE